MSRILWNWLFIFEKKDFVNQNNNLWVNLVDNIFRIYFLLIEQQNLQIITSLFLNISKNNDVSTTNYF